MEVFGNQQMPDRFSPLLAGRSNPTTRRRLRDSIAIQPGNTDPTKSPILAGNGRDEQFAMMFAILMAASLETGRGGVAAEEEVVAPATRGLQPKIM
jgi:hypothetical protein